MTNKNEDLSPLGEWDFIVSDDTPFISYTCHKLNDSKYILCMTLEGKNEACVTYPIPHGFYIILRSLNQLYSFYKTIRYDSKYFAEKVKFEKYEDTFLGHLQNSVEISEEVILMNIFKYHAELVEKIEMDYIKVRKRSGQHLTYDCRDSDNNKACCFDCTDSVSAILENKHKII